MQPQMLGNLSGSHLGGGSGGGSANASGSAWESEPRPAVEGGEDDVDLDELAMDLEASAEGMYHPDDEAGLRDIF
jgi:hypothetical protein